MRKGRRIVVGVRAAPASRRGTHHPAFSAFAFALAALTSALVACSETKLEDGPLIVGVQTRAAGAVQRAFIEIRLDGAILFSEERDLGVTGIEVPVALPDGHGSATLAISVLGKSSVLAPPIGTPTGGQEETVVERRARGTLVRGAKRLLRIQLESSCIFAAFGGTAPTCSEPVTCRGGACVDASFTEADLEPYRSDWASAP